MEKLKSKNDTELNFYFVNVIACFQIHSFPMIEIGLQFKLIAYGSISFEETMKKLYDIVILIVVYDRHEFEYFISKLSQQFS